MKTKTEIIEAAEYCVAEMYDLTRTLNFLPDLSPETRSDVQVRLHNAGVRLAALNWVLGPDAVEI